MHVELFVESGAVIRLSAPTLCFSVVHGTPVDLRLMALSVVVLPSSDGEVVVPWKRHISF